MRPSRRLSRGKLGMGSKDEARKMDQRTPSYEPRRDFPSQSEQVELSAQKARQAIELGTMRYVLGVSLGLAIVVIAVAYFLFVVFHR